MRETPPLCLGSPSISERIGILDRPLLLHSLMQEDTSGVRSNRRTNEKAPHMRHFLVGMEGLEPPTRRI